MLDNQTTSLSHAIMIIYCISRVEEVKILKMLFIIIYNALFCILIFKDPNNGSYSIRMG